MANIDEFGNIIYSAPNSFLDVVFRMLTDKFSIILTVVPLIVLVGGFFIIKYYSNNNKRALKIYSLASLIIYIIYFLLITNLFILA